jgi:hypothetical protein
MFLDADKPVPDGLFTATVAAKRNPIRRGVVLVTAGFGAAAALASIDGPALVGLVPAFVGAGELIAWWLERRMSRDLPFDDVTAR